MVVCKFKLKMSENKIKDDTDKTQTYRNATAEDIKTCNHCIWERISDKILQGDTGIEQLTIDFINAIKEAAEEHLKPTEPNIEQSYISDKTWELIEERWKAKYQHELDKEEELYKKVKRSVQKDKRKFIMNSIKEITDQREKWTGVKSMKIFFTPLYTKLGDRDFKKVKKGQRADAIADYLEQKH